MSETVSVPSRGLYISNHSKGIPHNASMSVFPSPLGDYISLIGNPPLCFPFPKMFPSPLGDYISLIGYFNFFEEETPLVSVPSRGLYISNPSPGIPLNCQAKTLICVGNRKKRNIVFAGISGKQQIPVFTPCAAKA